MTKVGLVFGGNRGIGLAITQELLDNNDFEKILVAHRPDSQIEELKKRVTRYPQKLSLLSFDPTSEDGFKKLAQETNLMTDAIDLCINSIGVLQNDRIKAERSLKEVTIPALMESFQTNTVISLMIAKHFKSLLQKNEASTLMVVSAKVGSIEDNKSGGWYSYRLSKAALNMALKNISIELNRLGKSCIVIAVHPGTTETQLSEPFLKNAQKKYIIHTPKETALNILKIAFNPKHNSYNGKFLSWNGEEIPW